MLLLLKQSHLTFSRVFFVREGEPSLDATSHLVESEMQTYSANCMFLACVNQNWQMQGGQSLHDAIRCTAALLWGRPAAVPQWNAPHLLGSEGGRRRYLDVNCASAAAATRCGRIAVKQHVGECLNHLTADDMAKAMDPCM